MKWHLTKTAPKGNKKNIVITYGPDGIRFSYLDENDQWRNPMGSPKNTIPTHWMPLPPKPETDHGTTTKPESSI